jgi:hypothetical protein
MEKVYSHEKAWEYIGAVVVCIITFVLCFWVRANAVKVVEWLVGIAFKNIVESLRIICLIFSVLLLAVMIIFIFMLCLGFYYSEITFSKEGVTFRRRFRPITIQKITDLKVVKLGVFRKERSLKIVGLTPEGKAARVTIFRKGNVGKRWEEFKTDLQKYYRG